MKIVYCLKSSYNSGGMERIVIAKANHFAQLGNEVWIITTDQKKFIPFFSIDEKIRCKDLSINYDEIENISFFSKLMRRREKLKEHKKRLQLFLNKINPDIIISTFGNEVTFLHKIKTSAKIIAEIHFARNYRLQLNQRGIRRLANVWLTYRLKHYIKDYDAFVCLTKEDSRNWSGLSNLFVIPNFIDSISPKPAKLENKSIISVGRLNYQKGYDRLIEVWKIVALKHPDWKLNIYGSGEQELNLRQLINSSNLSSSIILNKPESDIYSKLKDASIYVLSSRYEGLPMVLLEAMACGLPIVSFDCQCGPRDLLSNNGAGLLVPNGDINEMAWAICELIESKEKRIQMGKEAYNESKKYLFNSIIDKWVILFNKLIQ